MRKESNALQSLFRDIFINLICGAAGFAIGNFLGKPLVSFVVLGFLGVTIFIFVLWNKHGRKIKLILSTHPEYYYTFDHEENEQVIEEVEKSFCYLGISSDSILEILRRWFGEKSISSYRILLMEPDCECLKQQEAFRKGYDINADLSCIPVSELQGIEKESEGTSQRIRGAIAVLKNTDVYRNGRLKICLFNEFLPWWMYLIDDYKAYIGVLENGKRGDQSPVMKLEKNLKYASPFDAFQNNFERLWHEAKDA